MSRRALGIAVVVIALAGLTAVLLVGRGDGGGPDGGGPVTADQYRDELAQALSHARLDADTTSAAGLRAASVEFRELVDELTAFVPPPEAAAMHARFVSGLDEYARMLERYGDAGPEGAVVFQQRMAELGGVANNEWVLGLNDLAAHGYVDYRAG